MFPAEFDPKVLESLPLITENDSKRIVLLLRNILSMRVLPHFKKYRGTDSITLAQIEKSLLVKRLEDEQGRIRAVSLIEKEGTNWTIFFHERVFDYFSFIIPASHAEIHVSEGTVEEQKILALSEFILRHQLEHILYPDENARELIRADVKFALQKSETDPTYFKLLKKAMSDELNGIKFDYYMRLIEFAKQNRPLEAALSSILNLYSEMIADLPKDRLHKKIVHYDTELKTKILGVCYRRAMDAAYSLIKRARFSEKLLMLFLVMIDHDEPDAELVFNNFQKIWGVVQLFNELDLPESSWDGKNSQELFQYFKEHLFLFKEKVGISTPEPQIQVATPKTVSVPSAMKSLAERIDEARENPLFPVEVLTAIEKNKPSTFGQSGSKYSEFIETLLAIPWGKIKKIEVPAEIFEESLDRSHFGLRKPKEIISDFFSNLIWKYRNYHDDPGTWHGNGSAFLFVGPPGVGKTSLAVSIAESLDIPYHKISLGGMSDEAEMRGHGFTYEGSKPGGIVQGLIKMGAANGVFIMDEVDKAEKFAISTLLEILDPEQNHLFHDKYVQTTIDIDLSNSHFILTANTLETVPPPVINRCEVVLLDRYSVDEKIHIARKYLISRIQRKYGLTGGTVSFDPRIEEEILRYIIKNYTHEAGVRQLERVIRTVFLRALRKNVLSQRQPSVVIRRGLIKKYLEEPRRPQKINEDDTIGEILGLGVNPELGLGSLIPVQVTFIKGTGLRRSAYLNSIPATGNIQKIMDESRTVATTAVLNCADDLGIDVRLLKSSIHFHFMGGATPKDGPSAGSAIALALASLLLGRPIRRDVAMTGEIDTQGRITAIGGLDIKLETAYEAGCKTAIIPMGNLEEDGSLARFTRTLNKRVQILTYDQWKSGEQPFDYKRFAIQVIGVDRLAEAADIALIDQGELASLRQLVSEHARMVTDPVTQNDDAKMMLCFPLMKDVQCMLHDMESPPEHCFCLIHPNKKRAFQKKFSDADVELRELDHSRRDLNSVINTMLNEYSENEDEMPVLALLGPYRFLSRIKPGLDADKKGRKLLYMANNYTIQKIQINSCKPVLNTVFAQLSKIGPDYMDNCPFLGELDGIHVVDLSFIPEKYRLDVRRAELLIQEVLNEWLEKAKLPNHADARTISR